MSTQFTRKISSLIPPKIASPSSVSTGKGMGNMTRVINFYQNLPRGKAPAVVPKTFSEKYYQKYIATNSSKPLVHFILFFLTTGYSLDYYFHLRHEH
ncbi:F1F0 ATP synthase subunit F [Starmerella bacillaris]|uniref:F1F0 ATP synthase subunit F n=1 Tax=Starmerella bacillaris TaxID=1247836 RepID=A0AAV5RP63_STABA|nr:F1F0 ATP synthase subunit F [Starmerella bacillaris]